MKTPHEQLAEWREKSPAGWTAVYCDLVAARMKQGASFDEAVSLAAEDDPECHRGFQDEQAGREPSPPESGAEILVNLPR